MPRGALMQMIFILPLFFKIVYDEEKVFCYNAFKFATVSKRFFAVKR